MRILGHGYFNVTAYIDLLYFYYHFTLLFYFVLLLTTLQYILYTSLVCLYRFRTSPSLLMQTSSFSPYFTPPFYCLSHSIPMTPSGQALTWVTTRSVADRSWFDLAALADICKSAWTLRRTGRPTHCRSGSITQHPWKKY